MCVETLQKMIAEAILSIEASQWHMVFPQAGLVLRYFESDSTDISSKLEGQINVYLNKFHDVLLILSQLHQSDDFDNFLVDVLKGFSKSQVVEIELREKLEQAINFFSNKGSQGNLKKELCEVLAVGEIKLSGKDILLQLQELSQITGVSAQIEGTLFLGNLLVRRISNQASAPLSWSDWHILLYYIQESNEALDKEFSKIEKACLTAYKLEKRLSNISGLNTFLMRLNALSTILEDSFSKRELSDEHVLAVLALACNKDVNLLAQIFYEKPLKITQQWNESKHANACLNTAPKMSEEIFLALTNELIYQADFSLYEKDWYLICAQAACLCLILIQLRKKNIKFSSSLINNLENYFEKLNKIVLTLIRLSGEEKYCLSWEKIYLKLSDLTGIPQTLRIQFKNVLDFLQHKIMPLKLTQQNILEEDCVGKIIKHYRHNGLLESAISKFTSAPNQLERLSLSLKLSLPYAQDVLMTSTFQNLTALVAFITPFQKLIEQYLSLKKGDGSFVISKLILAYTETLIERANTFVLKHQEINKQIMAVASFPFQSLRVNILASILSDTFIGSHNIDWSEVFKASLKADEISNEINLIKDYHNELKATREPFEQASQNLTRGQIRATEATKALINIFLDNSISLLGPSPCKIGLLLLGSTSWGTRLKYSDVELSLLYEPNQVNDIDSKLETVHYIAYLLCLLELQIIFLGESHEKKQGFWLDEASIRKYHFLRDTPEYLIKEGIQRKEIKSTESYANTNQKLHSFLHEPYAFSLMNAKLVNEGYGGGALYECYQDLLIDYLNKGMSPQLVQEFSGLPDKRLLAPYSPALNSTHLFANRGDNRHNFSIWMVWDVFRRVKEGVGLNPPEEEASETINIKNLYYKPIAYLGYGLSLYYNVGDTQQGLEAVFSLVNQKGLLSKHLADWLTHTFGWLTRLRNKLHQSKQVEELPLKTLSLEERNRLARLAQHINLIEQALLRHLQACIHFPATPLDLEYQINMTFDVALNRCKNKFQYETWFLHVTGYLLDTQQSLIVHRQYYKKIPDQHRHACLTKAAETFCDTYKLALITDENRLQGVLYLVPKPKGLVYEIVNGEGKIISGEINANKISNKFQDNWTRLNQVTPYKKSIIEIISKQSYTQKDPLWIQENYFWEQLFNAPNERGERLSYLEDKGRWHETIFSCFALGNLKRGLNIQVNSLILSKSEKFHLSEKLTTWLLNGKWIDGQGRFVKKAQHHIAKTMPGNHLVIPYPDKSKPKFYLKVFPEYPLVELFLHDFGRRLGTYTPRFVDVWKWECGNYHCPILVSQAVPGSTLQVLLENKDDIKLHNQAFNEHVVLSALTALEDTKGDNLIACKTRMGIQLKLIDAERWFVPTFHEGELQVKDITFCLDQMHQTIDPIWREEFLILDAKQLVIDWFNFIEEKGELVFSQFKQKIGEYHKNNFFSKRAANEKTLLLPPLQSSMVLHLVNHIYKLQQLIAVQPQVNFFQLISAIEPRLANHYGRAYDKELNLDTPLERFDFVAGHGYSRINGGREYYTSQINFVTQREKISPGLPVSADVSEDWKRDIALAKQDLRAFNESHSDIEYARRQLTKRHDLRAFENLSLRGREKILHKLDWSRLSSILQKKLLAEIKTTYNFQHLSFINLNTLKDVDLIKILKRSPNLLTLTLNNTPNITTNFFETFCMGDCSLKYLNLQHLPYLTALGRLKTTIFNQVQLMLPNLEKLTILNSKGLHSLNIDAPLLNMVQLRNLPQLNVCRAYSHSLSNIVIEDCQSLSAFELYYLSIGNKIELPVYFKAESLSQESSDFLNLLNVCPVLFNLKIKDFPTFISKHLKKFECLLFEQAIIGNTQSLNVSQIRELCLGVLKEMKELEELALKKILSTLFALTKDKDPIVRQGICDALRQIEVIDGKVIDTLLLLIKDRDRDVRRNTCKALSKLGVTDEKVIDALLALTKDKDPIVRQDACQVLGQLGATDKKVLDALLVLTKDRDWDVEMAAWKALVQLGVKDEKLIDRSFAFMKSMSEYVRIKGCKALISCQVIDSEVIEVLLVATKNEETIVRIGACRALGDYNRLTKSLLEAINDKDEYVQRAACQALGSWWVINKKVIDVLIVLTKDTDWYVVTRACQALSQLGVADKKVIDALIALTKSYNICKQSGACEALGQLGVKDEEVIAALLVATKNEDETVRRKACQSLGKLGVKGEKVIDVLLALTKDRKWGVRRAACQALGQLGADDKQAIEALLALTKDNNGRVRIDACEVLGQLGGADSQVIAALIAFTKDRSEYVRSDACRALGGQLGAADKDVIDALLASTKDSDEYVRSDACRALGHIIQSQFEKILNDFKRGLEKLNEGAMASAKELVRTNIDRASLFSPIVQNRKMHILSWEINNVPGDGNCFYHVLVAQLTLINHERLKEIPVGTAPEDALRLDIQQNNFSDTEWTGDEGFEVVVCQYNVVLAIVDARNPESGFTCYFIDDDDNYGIDTDGEFELPDRPVIKMAYTGNHYTSVVSHPALNTGAYRQASQTSEVNNNNNNIISNKIGF